LGYSWDRDSEAIIMNMSRVLVLSAATTLIIGTTSIYAAPCESVASANASTAYQKVDALLGEKMVAIHLQAIGLSSEQAQARLSQLTERQINELAAQADLIQVGGTIQGGNLHKLGPLDCMFHQVGVFFTNVYRLIFCWKDLK
jgi:hypothetical protein